MRKVSLIFIALLLIINVKAQNSKQDNKVEIIYCSDFRITKTLKEIAESQPAYQSVLKQIRKESEDKKYRLPYKTKKNANALPLNEDPANQKTMGSRQAQTLLASWEGILTSSYPPDPSGAAGINHYVQAVNSSYQIFSKTGSNIGGPYTLGSLLFNSNEGDPIVLYDKYADRWVITEFKSVGWSAGKVLFAISKTNDPTGQYYTYQYSSPQFPDYPKFSIWSDGYYMTSNQSSQKVFVFERDSMLAGVSTARGFYKTFTPTTDGFFCPLPADADGQLPPAGTPCPIFTYEDDAWGGTSVDRINIYNMSVSWGTTPTATITLAAQLPTQAFDASYNSSWQDIAQPGTNMKLDGIGGVFTFRAQYRRWTGYNTVVLNKGVKIDATSGQRSIRWYELRQNTTTGEWSIYQQSTFAPDNLNRWVGSIAMDDNGSIGLAYSVSGSSNVYPSIAYTGRLASDSLNTMTFAEQIVISGNSSQTSNNRYGDYSHTSLDPVDGTIFWHTGEYIYDGEPATRIFSFKFPVNNIGVNETQNALSFTAYNSNGEIKLKINNLPNNNELIVDLFDIKGNFIEGKKLFPVSNKLETSFNSFGLSKGTYLLRIGNVNSNFQKVTKIIID